MDSAIQRLNNRGQAFSQKLCHHMGSWLSLLRLERKQNNYSNPLRIRIFLFLSYSFETINTFRHHVVHSKTIPDSRPKWAKCIPVFRPKRRKNTTRSWDGTAHTSMAYIKEPPPRACCTETLPVITGKKRNVKVFFCLPLHSIKSLHNLKPGLR